MTNVFDPAAPLLQCLPADTLAVYSIGEQSRLDEQGLRELCPTMLQQLDAGTCRGRKEEESSAEPSPRPTDAEGERNKKTEAHQEGTLLEVLRGQSLISIIQLLKHINEL